MARPGMGHVDVGSKLYRLFKKFGYNTSRHETSRFGVVWVRTGTRHVDFTRISMARPGPQPYPTQLGVIGTKQLCLIHKSTYAWLQYNHDFYLVDQRI